MADPDQLADDTVQITIYPKQQKKQQWEHEKPDAQSLSQYVVTKVDQARADEQVGRTGDTAQTQELEAEIDRLETALERERQRRTGRQGFEDPELGKRFLTPHAQGLEDILQQIVESGCLDQFIRQPVEDTLYFLAQQHEVEFSRDKTTGWRLTEGEA